MIPQRFRYLKLIVRFLYAACIKGNEAVLAGSVVLGVLGRILALGGFAMTLQAILAAIRPEIAMSLFNRAIALSGLPVTLQEADLILALIGAIILIYTSNWFLQLIRCKLTQRVSMRVIKDERNFLPTRSVDDDIVVLEQLPSIIQSVEKCSEIGLFMIIIIAFISVFAPMLALLLLPVLATLVVVQILGGRANLRELKQQQDARSLYVNRREDDGKLVRRENPEDTPERDTYLAIREHRRQRTLIKPQSDAIVTAVAISIVIYYLSNANLSVEKLAGLLVVFVIGIRYVISSGRELSVNFSKVLELRKYTELMAETVGVE